MHDFPIKELRRVSYHMEGATIPSERFMHESQVDVFVAAIVELHFTREVNPHIAKWNEQEPNRPNKSDGKTARVREIYVGKFFDRAGPYWWTTSGMEDNGKGASILLGWDDERVWAHPDILASEANRSLPSG